MPKCPLLISMVLALSICVIGSAQYVEWIVDDQCPENGNRRDLKQVFGEIERQHPPAPHSQQRPTSTDTSKQPQREQMQIQQKYDTEKSTENHHDERSLLVGATSPVTFNLKLHWRQGYCWQREWIERRWCLECPGTICSEGDFLWTQECNQYNPRQRFEWVQIGLHPSRLENQGLLKVANEDLCLQEVIAGIFRLRLCDEFNDNQKLVGFDQNAPFELRPNQDQYSVDYCLTQKHHPKPLEELISEPCYVAQRDRTSYWEVYKSSETGLSLRFPSCRPNIPCGVCEGDCTTDSDCLGRLRCFQRSRQNADYSVPGCEGVPLGSYVDYCYDPQ